MLRFFQKPIGQVVANTSAIVATTVVANATYNAGASVYRSLYNSSWFKEQHRIPTETAKASSSDPQNTPMNFK